MSNQDKSSLVVYAITPVQGFIANARKLRDYWTGSVILSYLSFWGIKTVCEKLGPESVIYPSLKNQSLVKFWVQNAPEYEKYFSKSFNCEETKEIASFPNKFVFECETNQVADFCKLIDESIKEKWLEMTNIVKNYLAARTNASGTFGKLWDNTVNDYWKLSFGSCKILKGSDKQEIAKYLSQDKFDIASVKSDTEILYSATHSLAQGILAAGKLKPTQIRNVQHGEKCPLCGEFEVLHDHHGTGMTSAKEYSESIKRFWDTVREKTNSDENNASQTKTNEKLCAVCAFKRYLPLVSKLEKKEPILAKLKRLHHQRVSKLEKKEPILAKLKRLHHQRISKLEKKEPILASVFENYASFPSTTEMAFFEKLPADESKRKKIAQKMHDLEIDLSDIDEKDNFGLEGKISDRDKYYAFILMDGDKMGDLINGETLNVSVSEEMHKKVSDALNDFARGTEKSDGVKQIISKTGGRLIYAGGDDVCAIVPLNKAIDAEYEISKAYKSAFNNLGLEPKSGKEVSISGGITIAHHKQPLKEIISGAHELLDKKAKEGAGRNALAIRLKKRSGGDRDFAFRWDETNEFFDEKILVLDSLKKVINAVEDGKLGQSLLYKIESLKEIFRTVLMSNIDDVQKKDQLFKLMKYEVSHSGKWNKESKEKDIEEYSKHLAGICIHPKKANCKLENGKLIDNNSWFTPEAAIIACFLANPEKKEGN